MKINFSRRARTICLRNLLFFVPEPSSSIGSLCLSSLIILFYDDRSDKRKIGEHDVLRSFLSRSQTHIVRLLVDAVSCSLFFLRITPRQTELFSDSTTQRRLIITMFRISSRNITNWRLSTIQWKKLIHFTFQSLAITFRLLFGNQYYKVCTWNLYFNLCTVNCKMQIVG